MKKVLPYLAIIIITLVSLGFTFLDDIVVPSKKLNKAIQKTFKVEDYELISVTDFSKVGPTTKIFKVFSDNGIIGYSYISRVYSCRSDGCGSGNELGGDDFEFFDYYIITDDKGRVEKVSVYNYEATQGHQIMGRGWLKQFVGFEGKTNLNYGTDIQAISGATISAKAITFDVMDAEKIIRSIIDEAD